MPTEKLYYADQYLREFDARVLSCRRAGKEFEVILDRTAFYPEGGGQPGDRGTLNEVPVTDTREDGGEIIHRALSPLPEGESVRGAIDWARRFDLMQQHSGEHIVSGVIHSRFGYNNVGFHLGEELITIDYDGDISWEQLRQVERESNRFIWLDTPVLISCPPEEELSAIPYRSKKELTGQVRIVTFPDADICACCGTHVARTGEIGLIKFVSLRKFREGVRIELLCGGRAYEYTEKLCEQNRQISGLLSAKPHETAAAVSRTLELINELKQRAAQAQEKMIEEKAAEYSGAGDVLLFTDGLSPDTVRRLCDAVGKSCGGRCAVFSGNDGDGYKYTVISGEDIRELAKEMNTALGGRGGGKPDFIQGSVSAPRAAIEAFFANR